MPYAPGIPYTPIRADMGQWGSALMEIMGRKDQQKEQAKQEAKQFKTLVAYGEQIGLNKDELLTKDLGTVRGMVEGTVAKNKIAEEGERLKQLMGERTAREALQRAMQSAGTQQAPARQVPAMIPGQPGVTMMDLPAMQVKRKLTPESVMEAMFQNPESFNAPQSTDLLRIMQAGGSVMPIATKVGGRDLIVNPNSGAFQDVTSTPAPVVPEGFVALGATEDENGRLAIRYGPPKAEGKALSQTEVAGITALTQAETDLDTLENIYKELGPNYGGPVSARVKSWAMGGQNPNIAALENAITAATPNLARGVFREVGVLTDQDVARYKQLLPAPADTQEVRTRKIKQLRDRISQGRKEMVTSLNAAGRDVEGFDTGTPAAPKRFDDEAVARNSGAKTGDVIELYDPGTATYRKARLK